MGKQSTNFVKLFLQGPSVGFSPDPDEFIPRSHTTLL